MRVFNREMPALEFVAMMFIIIGILAIILIFSVADIGEVFEGKAEHTILEFGDFLGGFVGSIWALAGVLLFYAAINEQRKDLEDQRDMMERQINEVVQQTNEFRKQSDTLQVQKNEETFFQLLRFHNEIITSITLEIQDIDFATNETRIRQIHGRKSFVEYYDIYKRFFHVQFENLSNPTPELLDKAINASYGQFYTEYQSDLGHYFRNLYNVLRFIDSLPEDQKKFYLSLLLAQLSNYELALLFFHGLDAHNNDFKLFLEKYTILTTVPNDEIINICRKLYDPKAFHPEGLEIQIEEDMFSFGDMGGMGDDFGMMGGFGGFGANSSANLEDDNDDEGMDSDILSKIASLNKAASGNSNKDLSENSILSRLSKIKNSDANIDDYFVNDVSNEEPSIGEDEIANRLNLIKQATSNKKADSFNSITGDIPQQFLDSPAEETTIQVDFLSKLSALSAKDKKDEEIETENIDNDIFAKINKLKASPLKEFDDEDWNAPLVPKIEDSQNPDNDIFAKINKLKAQAPNDFDDDDWNTPIVPNQEDEQSSDNDIFAKLNKLKTQAPKEFEDDDWNTPIVPKKEEEQNTDNDIFAKINKLKASPLKEFDDEDWNAPLVPKIEDSQNPDNDIFAKINKLKAQAPNDFEDDDWNTPIVPKKEEEQNSDNDIFAKINKLKTQAPKEFDDDDWNTPIVPNQEDEQNTDNDIFAKLNKLKNQAPNDFEDDDWNAPLVPKQEDEQSSDNDILGKLNKLNKSQKQSQKNDDFIAPISSVQVNDFANDSNIVENFQLENPLSNFNLESLKSANKEKLVENAYPQEKKQNTLKTKNTKNLSSLSKYLKK